MLVTQPKRGRLHLKEEPGRAGAWAAASGDTTAWLQIDLIKKYVKIKGVTTQGRHGAAQWVTKYSLLYGNDTNSLVYYKEQGQSTNKVSVIRSILIPKW